MELKTVPVPPLSLLGMVPTVAQVTVTGSTAFQTIGGFGVSDAFQRSGMSSTNLDTLFSTTGGAGMSLLRTPAPANCADFARRLSVGFLDLRRQRYRGHGRPR